MPACACLWTVYVHQEVGRELRQVQPDAALATANQLALEYQIWERPLGLAGVWGGLVRAWLDALLPDDAHVQCSGRVKLVVTEVRRRRRC